jgi:hypothetical protein
MDRCLALDKGRGRFLNFTDNAKSTVPTPIPPSFQILFAYYCLKVHLNNFSKIKSHKEVIKQYYFSLMVEGSGSGSVPLHLTNGSGSGRFKNLWIRIRNTDFSFAKTNSVPYLGNRHITIPYEVNVFRLNICSERCVDKRNKQTIRAIPTITLPYVR